MDAKKLWWITAICQVFFTNFHYFHSIHYVKRLQSIRQSFFGQTSYSPYLPNFLLPKILLYILYVLMYMCMYMYVYMYVYMHVYVYVYACICVCICSMSKFLLHKVIINFCIISKHNLYLCRLTGKQLWKFVITVYLAEKLASLTKVSSTQGLPECSVCQKFDKFFSS